MTIDNAILHYYPMSPYIAKAAVNLRFGSKIVFSVVLRDDEIGEKFLDEKYPDIPRKRIVHI